MRVTLQASLEDQVWVTMARSPVEHGLAAVTYMWVSKASYEIFNEVEFFHYSFTNLHTCANNLSSLIPSFHPIWMTKSQTWWASIFSTEVKQLGLSGEICTIGQTDVVIKSATWASRYEPVIQEFLWSILSPPLATTPQIYSVLVKSLTTTSCTTLPPGSPTQSADGIP